MQLLRALESFCSLQYWVSSMTVPFQGRGTLFFTSPGNSGWSESYYLQGPDYASCASQLGAVAEDRLAVLQLSLTLVRLVVSNIYLRGDAFLVGGGGGPGTWPTSPEYLPLDYALLYTWQAGPYSRNKTFLRGIPLEMQTDGSFTPTSPYQTALNAYEESVVSNCLVRQYVVNPTPPPAMIYQFNVITAGTPHFNLARRKTGRPFGLPRGRLVAP